MFAPLHLFIPSSLWDLERERGRGGGRGRLATAEEEEKDGQVGEESSPGCRAERRRSHRKQQCLKGTADWPHGLTFAPEHSIKNDVGWCF